MLKPQRLLARRPLDQLPKQRLRALKPRDRARIGPWRAGLLAAHRPPITIHASQRWFAHRAVSLPGAIEQVEQIFALSRWRSRCNSASAIVPFNPNTSREL